MKQNEASRLDHGADLSHFRHGVILQDRKWAALNLISLMLAEGRDVFRKYRNVNVQNHAASFC